MKLTELEKDVIYNPQQLKTVDPSRIPQHVAIIPDGNRRWAKRNFLMPEQGHRAGADQLMTIVEAATELGIKTLTFYIFSTENWSRPAREIKAQLWLLEKSLIEQRPRMIKNGINFSTIGNLAPFPENILNEVQKTVDVTQNNTKINVVFALNYGGRDDITRAVREIAQECALANIVC
jgi:undecaprenyl diphosphate synthase